MIIELRKNGESFARIDGADEIIIHYDVEAVTDASVAAPLELVKKTLLATPGVTIQVPAKCDHYWDWDSTQDAVYRRCQLCGTRQERS